MTTYAIRGHFLNVLRHELDGDLFFRLLGLPANPQVNLLADIDNRVLERV